MVSKFVLILVFLFDLIAFGLAVAAEQRRSTGKVVNDAQKNYQYYVYNSDIATSYGSVVLLFLLASQILIMSASKCFCCGPSLKPGGSRACALILFLLCWFSFLIAEACLLAGSVRNAYHYRYTKLFSDDPPSCHTVRKGVFAAGAAFTFFTAIISEFYYVSYAKSRTNSNNGYGREQRRRERRAILENVPGLT